jgi:hypothetical protein
MYIKLDSYEYYNKMQNPYLIVFLFAQPHLYTNYIHKFKLKNPTSNLFLYISNIVEYHLSSLYHISNQF